MSKENTESGNESQKGPVGGVRLLPKSFKTTCSLGKQSGSSTTPWGSTAKDVLQDVLQENLRMESEPLQSALSGHYCAAQLYPFTYAGNIHYVTSSTELTWHLGHLLLCKPVVIGFDIEWRPSFTTGVPPNRTALMQLCFCHGTEPSALGTCEVPATLQPSTLSTSTSTLHSGPKIGCLADSMPPPECRMGLDCTCLLLHVAHAGMQQKTSGHWTLLKKLLESSRIQKAGLNIMGDAAKIKADFGIEMGGLIELKVMANERCFCNVSLVTTHQESRRWSLAGLIEVLMHRTLFKPHHLRCGNWEAMPLSREQQLYAAYDAFASLSAYNILKDLPKRHELIS
ncbi:hypothetical protein CEUSTIGMA_g1330.t1 [Chlamydomonas eustigma]|uniref:3'-5' exonuclease n=1 Tax=Chlamydomonas eustigma TaxID=1157962 RepID=A0A250WTM4_9CHLO|nr:hypothetical protein CEUSTIGMA_g1330.t1 [Chlamydomonas eustigma]|eukprot:GAX73880.1 hypothetical protein CEUSTIGMA_g1330.t1 [Chlamydomonas eustigma]